MTCAIEIRESILLSCRGIDTKLYIFQINPSGKKKEKLNMIEKLKELTGWPLLIDNMLWVSLLEFSGEWFKCFIDYALGF
jgi:hypothetical protein